MSILESSRTLTGGSLLAKLLSQYGIDYVVRGPRRGSAVRQPLFAEGKPRYILVLLVGMKGNVYATWFWRHPRQGQRVVHLDVDPAEPGKAWAEVIALVGDAEEGLKELRMALHGRSSPDCASWLEEVSELRRLTWGTIEAEQNHASARPDEITPAVQLAAELPPDAG